MSVKIFLGMFLLVPFSLLFSAERALLLLPGMTHSYAEAVQGARSIGTSTDGLEQTSIAINTEPPSTREAGTSPEAVVAVPRGLPVVPTISGEQLWQESVLIGGKIPNIIDKITSKDRYYKNLQFDMVLLNQIADYVIKPLNVCMLFSPEPGSRLLCAGVLLLCKAPNYVPSGWPQDRFINNGQKYRDFLSVLKNENAINIWPQSQNLSATYECIELLETLTGNMRDSVIKSLKRNKEYSEGWEEKDSEEIEKFANKTLYSHVEICHRVAQYLRHKESLRNESE
jgi:hypothetical protein